MVWGDDAESVFGEEADCSLASDFIWMIRGLREFSGKDIPPLPDPGVPEGLKIPFTPFLSVPMGENVCVGICISDSSTKLNLGFIGPSVVDVLSELSDAMD